MSTLWIALIPILLIVIFKADRSRYNLGRCNQCGNKLEKLDIYKGLTLFRCVECEEVIAVWSIFLKVYNKRRVKREREGL